MARLKIGFVLDPPEKIKALEDTSFYIMKAAREKGHEVHYIDSRHVSVRAGRVIADTASVDPNFNDGFRFLERYRDLPLESLDAVFIRKDPPFDEHYLYLSYMLEMLKGKTAVLNDPRGIRDANEKFYALNFPDWIPETSVSGSARVIEECVDSLGDAVVKPLSQRGGMGVIRVRRSDPDRKVKIAAVLEEYGTVVAQKFLPEVMQGGDKRILVMNGEILGGYVRVPPRGDFRVSIYHDGRYEPAVFTEREKEMVRAIAPKLLADGLLFVGLDVIGGFISEINVTSPAGIPESSHFAGRLLENDVVSFIEKLIAGHCEGAKRLKQSPVR